jgi:hypothetical protein
MPLILPARTLDSGFNIDNSLRFNDGDSPRLNITPSAGNRRTWTFSCWLKRGNISSYQRIFSAYATGDNEHLIFRDTDQLHYFSGDATIDVKTNAVYRDPSAWYHIVCAVDTTDGTAASRVKLYVNGSQVTSLATATYPSADADTGFNENVAHDIGRSAADAQYFDGYMSDVYFIDGTQYAASDFGETDDNGVWIPKAASVTFGTNGFKLEFQQTGTGTASASTIGADTSGNTNHLTSTNLAATDVTVDSPTNNWCTMNPIHKSIYGSVNYPTFSEGNLKIAMNTDSSTSSTMAPSKGKWYVEYKQSENTADNGGYPVVGISATLGGQTGDVIGFKTPDGSDYRGQKGTSSVSNAFGSARESGDIFGFYINLDDEILIVHKNGSDYMGSGASSGIDWSGGLTTTDPQTGFYHFYVQNNSDGTPRYTDEVNFGNPTFSISSGNADANGYGNFEYSPTLSGTNYYALCTKNLAEYG